MKAKHFLCAFLCVILMLTLFSATAAASGGYQKTGRFKDTIQSGIGESKLISGFVPASFMAMASADSQDAAATASIDEDVRGSDVGWWIAMAAIVSIIAFLIIFRKKVLKLLPRVLYILLILILVISLIVPAGGLLKLQSTSSTLNTASKTVYFETNGGSDIPAAEVPPGGTLDKIPTPAKTDYAFTGWYTDAALTNNFYSDAPITSDMTLYASYTPTQINFKQYEDPGKYAEDCDPNYTVAIVSPAELTNDNLSAYVQATAYTEGFPELNVSGNGSVYTISPTTSYPAGGHYRFTLLSDALSFQGESDAVRSWDFRIHKDPVSIIEPKDDIHYILWSEVNTQGEGAYYVPASLGIKKGDTVCFWDGEINDETRFCHIQRAASPKKIGGKSMTLLTTEESQLSEILDKVDVCFKQDIPMEDSLSGVNVDKIAMDTRNSAGTRELTNLMAHALLRSPSFQDLMSEPNEAGTGIGTLAAKQPPPGGIALDDGVFSSVEENDDQTSIELENILTEGLKVNASVGTAQNENFPDVGSDGWAVLTLTISYETVIKDKVQINAAFTVKEYIKSTIQGNAIMGGIDILRGRLVPDMQFDYAINNYSQTQLDLSVLIKSKDNSDKDYLNITEEFEKLTNTDNEDDSDVAGILGEVLGSKGDDIDLVDAPLASHTFTIIPQFPIFKLKSELNFTISVNFAAGISAHTTVMTAKQAGMRGSISGGVSTYQNTLSGDNRYSFDFYCAGYLGFKAGLKLGLTLSVNGLPKLGEVGVEGAVGAYLDLYGFVHLNISKTKQSMDTVNSSVQGGLYMETGIYVDLGVSAKSEWFKAKAEADLLELKFPLFNLGNRYVLLRFTGSDSIIINEEQYPLYGSAGLFDGEYIDITTGEIVTGNYTALTDFSVQFSSPYFSYNYSTINVLKDRFGQDYSPMVSPQTKRLDAIVYVYYTGASLNFFHQLSTDAVKQINLTWIDSSVNIEDYPDIESVKATYVVDIDGTEQQVAEKLVPFGDIPGSIDYSDYLTNCNLTGFTNDPTQPILQDTVYTIHLKRYERLVSYITYHGGSWHFDVYAVRIGDVPIIPEGYDSPGPGLNFTGWIGKPGASAGNLNVTNAVTAVDYNVTNASADENLRALGYPVNDYVYLDLDTTKPVYSVSGTYDECCSSYYQLFQGVPYNTSSHYLYTAQYQGGPFKINFVYPAMEYMFNGTQQSIKAETYTFKVDFYEEIPLPPEAPNYQGCDMLGWDADGDGEEDYSTFAELPRATRDMTIKAVIKHKTYTVTVLDINDKVAQKLTVNCGDLPAVIKTEPAYPGSGDYQFKYWAVSKSGGRFTQWSSGSDPGVLSDWTIKPVYNKLYTVTFDYAGGTYNGEQSKVVKLEPGAYNVDDMVKGVAPTKGADKRNTYAFAGWYYNDKPVGGQFDVTGDMIISAKYTAAPIMYTAEFHTGTGAFSDGNTSAKCTDDYDSFLKFIDDFMAANPLKTHKAYTTDKIYTLESWDVKWSGDTSVRYDAVWSSEPREYTVTFDASGGTFTGGLASIEQTYHYNDTIIPPDNPAKADDGTYSYAFIGWSPSLAPVTGDCTYIATYRAARNDVAETGITVSDGVHAEDINCNGKDVSGYTYELQKLTITGDGLTLSGNSSDVYVEIGQSCNSVSFDGLKLQGAYAYSKGVLYIPSDTSSGATATINVSGNCSMENTSDGKEAIRSMRPYVLSGQGTDSRLDVSSVGTCAIYSQRGVEVDNLTLNVNADNSAAFFGDCGESDNVWRFVDSTVTAQGAGVIEVFNGSVELIGDSDVTLVSKDNGIPAILLTGQGNLGCLRFVDFTGTFSAYYQDTAATGPAIKAASGITFAPDASNYDLGGAQIVLIDGYYTFAVDSGGELVDQPQVHVMPRT